jgi:hypothetical protein
MNEKAEPFLISDRLWNRPSQSRKLGLIPFPYKFTDRAVSTIGAQALLRSEVRFERAPSSAHNFLSPV